MSFYPFLAIYKNLISRCKVVYVPMENDEILKMIKIDLIYMSIKNQNKTFL